MFTVIAWQASFQSMDASAAATLSGQTTVMLKNVPMHFGFRTCAQISMCFSELGTPKNYGSSYGLLFSCRFRMIQNQRQIYVCLHVSLVSVFVRWFVCADCFNI